MFSIPVFARYILVLQIVLLLFLQFSLWGNNSVAQRIWQLNQDIAKQKEKNDVLWARNQKVAAEIHALKNGPELMEEKARLDLGMIKDGETFFWFAE